MDKLSKKEFEVLYYIWSGRNSLERLRELIDKKSIVKIIQNLEKLGLIKISYRDNEIYGFMETEKGRGLLHSKEYDKMLEEVERD